MDRMIIESPGSKRSRYLIDEDNTVIDLMDTDLELEPNVPKKKDIHEPDSQ